MAAIKASVNLFALLDGNDPGDKRLVDFDSELSKEQPKKKPAELGYKPKKQHAAGQGMNKKPASAAAPTKKKPTSAAASGFKSDKNSPAMAAGCKASRKNLYTPAVAGPTAASMAKATNKQTTLAHPTVPAPSPNLTAVLFAYPSARERIFKQRQEEFERRQATERQEEYERQQAKENGGSVIPGDDNDSKSAAAGAPSADKRKGKTHGVRRVQQQQGGGGGYHYVGGAKKPQADATVKGALLMPPPSEKPVASPVVQTPPPSINDICQFPSLK